LGHLSKQRIFLAFLQLAERELLYFAIFWFIISALGEVFVDMAWLWLRLAGRSRKIFIDEADEVQE